MLWFNKISKPILGLAPMHQVSRADLRIACKKAGADIVFSEMVASEAIIRRVPQAWEMMKFSKAEEPMIIQIFGNDPLVMAQASKMVKKELHPAGIDINFGCPVQKAEKQGFGSCQLKDPESAGLIVESVRQALGNDIALSVKIRIPDKDIASTLGFIKEVAEAGIDMVTIHGRTPTQKYKGEADWSHAYEVKNKFPDLLVLGSGDIRSEQDFKNKIGNLDGALIGRWAKNHPEIFTEINEAHEE